MLKPAIWSNYDEKPDVIFVCVKGYSLDENNSVYKKSCQANDSRDSNFGIYTEQGSVCSPSFRVYSLLTAAYTSRQISQHPGVIKMHGDIFKVIYGVRHKDESRPVLKQIEEELSACGINGILSDNIQRDALQKFSYISSAAACGLYYNSAAEGMQKPGEIRDCFVALISEIKAIADAMGIEFKVDIVKTNLDILDNLAPTASTSMQRDIEAGKEFRNRRPHFSGRPNGKGIIRFRTELRENFGELRL